MRLRPGLLWLGLSLALLLPFSAQAVPPGFALQTVGSGWNEAVGITFAADGRMFVWERGGRIWFVDAAGQKSAQPVLDISDEVGGWRDYGLLGVALHPNFLNNGLVYLLYVVDRHHLINAGAPSYDPGQDDYFAATIGRVTRYRIKAEDNFLSTDYDSRLVLIGETIDSGIPILHQSHGTGALAFGTDGTLLGSAGDGASYSSTDTGSASETYYAQGLSDGIIRSEENVGAFRSQMLSSFNGKIFRIDPDTGDGVPSNPFYDGAAPRSVQSRTFALGLRNPYRFVKRPGTGSHDEVDGDPGSFYIGDVGWGTWEDIHVLKAPGQNFGWPAFEGIDPHPDYMSSNAPHLEAPNPLFGQNISGVGICNQQYFRFSDLIQQATLDPTPSFPNPCDPAQEIPDSWNDGQTTWSYFKFVHSRPEVDYRHGTGPSRWSGWDGSNNPVSVDIGQGIPGGKTVPGPQFGGNASTGGAFVTTDVYGPTYENTYFHGDYGSQWIRNFVFDANQELVEVRDFSSAVGGVVDLATDPIVGELYFIQWTAVVYRVAWVGVGNQPPTAVASQDVGFGPGPLTVNFTGDQSTDPEDDPLSYSWDFGDGSPLSTSPNPSHTFSAPPGVPTPYTVTLTVTDDQANGSQPVSLLVSVNNSPPVVDITSPVDGALYSMEGLGEFFPMTATISDAEQASGFTCVWGQALHHNDHDHPEPSVNECTTSAQFVVTPVGCDGNTYFYRASLRVTDSGGLTTLATADMWPDCPNEAPLARNDSASVAQGYGVDIDVLANDIDPDGDGLDPASVVVVVPPLYGNTNVNATNGVITYTHDASPGLVDSFTYTVTDLDAEEPFSSSEAIVSITAFNSAPTVSMTAPTDLSTFAVPDSIALSANGSDPEDGSSIAYQWSVSRIHNDQLIPDVYAPTGANPADFAVPAVGAPGDRISYRVQVTVSDVVGATGMDAALILPGTPPVGNTPPVAAFTASPSQVVAGLSIDFDASTTSDAEGDYLTYRWDFGDGTTASGAQVSHAFLSAGNPSITLTVIDAGGAQDTANLGVTIIAPGLEGSYYNNIDLTDDANNPALVRTDPVIDFTWADGSPDPAIQADDFSVRWVGRIQPLYSETYTMYTVSDDGIRLWIDGNLVVDSWIDQGPTEHSGSIALIAGVLHEIQIEYYENGGGAVARLLWSSASQPKQAVPAGQLFPPGPPNTPPLAVDDISGTLTIYPVPIDVLANDSDDNGQIDPTSVVATDGSFGTTSVDLVTGIVTYTPDGVTTGTDAFSYTVDDLNGLTSNPANVSVNVLEPSAIDITSPTEGSSFTGPNVVITYDITGDPSLFDHIHWVLDSPPHTSDHIHDGSWTFFNVPPGPHTAYVDMRDAQHNSVGFPNSADQVSFTVLPSNYPPVTRPESTTVLDSQQVVIAVLDNDTDDTAIDPSTVQIASPASNGSLAVDPVTGAITYTHDGTQATPDSFTYTVDDFLGLTSNASLVTVHMTDGDLTLDALSGSTTIVEGASFGFSATATSASGNPVSFEWDLDGDGQYDDLSETPGIGSQTSSGSTSLLDDGIFNLGVRVSDGAGRTFVQSFAVTVTNAAPTLDSLTGDLTVETAQSFAYSATALDAGPVDVLSFDWDLDDDGQFDDFNQVTGPSPQTVGANLSFPAIGVYTVSVRVKDDDGASVVGSFEVTVVNASPTLDFLTGDLGIDEAGSFGFAATASDPDFGDILTFEWDLDGDGQYDDLSESPGTGSQSSSGTGSFDDDGVFQIGVRITDGAGGETIDSFQVTVQNVNPQLVGDWAERRLLSFDNSAQAEGLSDFPVLVLLDPSRIDYSLMQPGGIDLRFSDLADNPLSHEVESWNPGGTSTVWVEVPSIGAGSTTDGIWMYYGNASVTASSEDSAGLWSNGYAAVWHLGADLLDSTGNANDGTNQGSTNAAGFIGDAQHFDGTGWIDMGNDASLAVVGQISLEAWIAIDDPAYAAAARIISKKNNWNDTSGYNLEHKPVEDNVTMVGSGGDYIRADAVGFDTSWHYVATTANGGTGAVYVDGVDATSDAVLSPIVAGTQALNLGRRSGGADYYRGRIDEVRISNVQRSAAWIAAQHRSMTDAFITYGAAETLDPLAVVIDIDEGGSFPFSATASDAGPLDTLTFDWELSGDGLYDDYSEPLGTSPQVSSGIATMPDDGSFSLGVRVTDDDGGQVTNSFDATVHNVVPTLDSLTGNLLTDEGLAFGFSATASDPGTQDILTFEWDLDGDGSYDDFTDAPGSVNQASGGNTVLGSEGIFDLGVRVSDGDGGEVTGSFQVTVVNAAPSLDAFTGDISIVEGDTLLLSATASDGGANDLITFEWDLTELGEGVVVDPRGTGTQISSVDVLVEQQGTFNVSLRISDGQGGEITPSLVATVTNADPEVFDVPPGRQVEPGVGFLVTASATDAGPLDPLTFSWDLDGDGSFDDLVQPMGAGGPKISWTHASIATPGLYYLGVEVTDGDGGSTIVTFPVDVGQAPNLIPALPAPARLILGALLGGAAMWRLRRRRLGPGES